MMIEKCPPLSIEGLPPLVPPTPKNEFKITIPVHRLPLLVQVQTIRTMDPDDWINMAMTSKRNERVVKLARIKTENPRIEICQDACIKFPSLKLSLLCCDPTHWTNTWKIMFKEDLKPWLNGPGSSMIEHAAILYQKVQNVFVFPENLTIWYCTNIERKATIQELLSNPVMKNWKDLTIYGTRVSSEDLKMIMDTATSRLVFDSRVENMPLNFKHENAFKFPYQIYYDARWVKIEDLYDLRNLVRVDLYRNLFTQEQLKSFVDYWVNSEVDMFLWIQIKSTESLSFDNLVDGLIGLKGSDPNDKLFLTLSKSSSYRRKKTMLTISYDIRTRSIFLEASDVNEKYTRSENEEESKKFENVGKILTLLHEKKELEDLLEVSNGEEKLELSEIINESIAALSEFNVIFIDGIVTHQLF